MATYTAPTTRASGYLVTAANWNTDIVENIKYFKDAPTFDGAITASSTLTVANNVGLAATKKLYLDGVAMTGDTYISESAANVLDLYAGGANTLRLNATGATVAGLLTLSGAVQHLVTGGAGVNGNTGFRIDNASAGTDASALIDLRGDSTYQFGIRATSSGYTGTYGASVGALNFSGPGGIGIYATHASGAIRFYAGGTTQYMQLGTTGKLSVGTSLTEYGRLNVANTTAQDLLFLRFTNTPATSSQFVTFLNSTGATAGYISMLSGDASVAYNTSSDARLKHDDGIVTDASNVLQNTRVHDFRWRSDGISKGRNVFAQEAIRVNPRAVTIGKNNDVDDQGLPLHPWMVDKTEYVPDLIVGWQQHDAQIQSLAARIAALESKS